MYQALGLPKLLRGILYFNAFFAAFLASDALGWTPDLPWFRVVSLTVLATTLVLSALGQTALFPWICRLPLVWRIFPDLDGRYAVEIASNWSLIDAREHHQPLPETDTADRLFRKSGTLTISARLYTIDIRLEMEDGYLTSDTIVCSVKKEPGEQRLHLSYIYRAKVIRPQATDSGQHFGAARIEIPKERKIRRLQGNYWTERNWHLARNTAGVITLQRRSR